MREFSPLLHKDLRQNLAIYYVVFSVYCEIKSKLKFAFLKFSNLKFCCFFSTNFDEVLRPENKSKNVIINM